MMSRILAACPRRFLNNYRLYSLCTGAMMGGWSEDLVIGEGMKGDVYLMHPLLLHCVSVSARDQPRCILNVPHPYFSEADRKDGSLCVGEFITRLPSGGGGLHDSLSLDTLPRLLHVEKMMGVNVF